MSPKPTHPYIVIWF